MLLVFAGAFSLAVFGCSTKETQKHDPFVEEWKAKAKNHVGYSPSASSQVYDISSVDESKDNENKAAAAKGKNDAETDAAMTAGMEEAKEEPVKTPVLPTQNVTIEKMKAPVAVMLRTMARAAGKNIIINENVSGEVNMDIKDAPWDQVFRAILKSHGLTYTIEGDIIRVISVKDYKAELELLEASQDIKAKRKEYDISSLTMERQLETVEPLQTKVIHVSYADTEDLKINLEHFIGNKPGDDKNKGDNKGAAETDSGSISVDKHTNSLIIHARPKDMSRIVSLVEKLDKPVPQVLIKAYIVEATKDTARDLGIQWGGLYHGGGAGQDKNYWITPGTYSNQTGMTQPSTAGYPGNSGVGVTPGSGDTVSPASGYGVNFPVDLSAGSGMSIGYVAEYIGEHVLAIQLSALQQSNQLNILSSPSITTLDNQSATIKSGREVPYRAYEEGAVSIKWREAVLKLEVTPHIIDDKTLKLEISTTKDEIDPVNDVDGNPIIIKKGAETKVILFDGQTTVIGGLNKEVNGGQENGVPGLKDVSVLGNLFRSEGKSNEMEELLIFITPHILKQRQDMEKAEQTSGEPAQKTNSVPN